MKRTVNRSTVLFILSALVTLGAIGCEGALDSNDPAQQGMTSLESGEYAILDFEDSMDAVQDATLDEPMEMDPELCSGEAIREGHRFGRHAPPCRGLPRQGRAKWGNHLGAILHAMKLTEEQREQVRELMDAHRECAREPLAAICENSRDIIEDANEQRRAILEAAKAGEITREEAHEQIMALNQATREASRENPDNQEAFEALCDCKLALFDGIRPILDEEQQAVWDAWVAMLEGPCFVEG